MFAVLKWRIGLFVFRWISDEDGDIGLQFCRIVTFIKYKESTLVKFGKRYQSAGKRQGHARVVSLDG